MVKNVLSIQNEDGNSCKLLDSKLGGYSEIDVNMCMLISVANDLMNVIQRFLFSFLNKIDFQQCIKYHCSCIPVLKPKTAHQFSLLE